VKQLSLIFCVTLLCGASTASAQTWANKMFEATDHDFGVVARNSKQQFRFKLKNIYVEDVHIARVRSSCGCTSPIIEKRTLKTHESGTILAVYNTNSFLGSKSATVTVTIDKPYYAEVQLNVQGFIRSDVVFNPGSIQFGEIAQGSSAEQVMDITYAGRTDWKITDVRSAYPHFEVELNEKDRNANRVNYRMLVRLKQDAPAGYIQDELTIVTDDPKNKTISLAVQGRVISPLTISPTTLILGPVETGSMVSKKIVVRGNAPFRITEITCNNQCLKIDAPDTAKKLHLIPVQFTAGETSTKMVETITIKTDLSGGTTATCVLTATVNMPTESP
jgi:hypothetical protein